MNDRKWLRLDLVIATIALVVSAGATLSSIYQTKVIANQLSASVWPYLSIDATLSDNTSYSLSATNDGLGPALIRRVTLFVDGRPVPSYRAAIAAVTHASHLRDVSSFKSSFYGIGPATVIRAADKHPLIVAEGLKIDRLGNLSSRVKLELCYCSLLDQCWDVVSQQTRHQVPSCSTNAGIDY